MHLDGRGVRRQRYVEKSSHSRGNIFAHGRRRHDDRRELCTPDVISDHGSVCLWMVVGERLMLCHRHCRGAHHTEGLGPGRHARPA